jgi:hypothetical protein
MLGLLNGQNLVPYLVIFSDKFFVAQILVCSRLTRFFAFLSAQSIRNEITFFCRIYVYTVRVHKKKLLHVIFLTLNLNFHTLDHSKMSCTDDRDFLFLHRQRRYKPIIGYFSQCADLN